MRLLHTTKFVFIEFFDDDIPTYCILSHRWGPYEVSYHEFLAGQKRNAQGFAKILGACKFVPSRFARDFFRDSWPWTYEWIWIDTCCID
jgi:hypothetical protein